MLQPLQCLRQVHHAEHAGFPSGPSMSCERALMGRRRRPHHARDRSDQSSWLEQALPRAIAHRLYLLHPPARTTVLRTHGLFQGCSHTTCVPKGCMDCTRLYSVRGSNRDDTCRGLSCTASPQAFTFDLYSKTKARTVYTYPGRYIYIHTYLLQRNCGDYWTYICISSDYKR